MVRDFAGVLDTEKAEMGLFICLYDATAEMELAALRAGYVDTPQGRKRRLQIVSMEQWFDGFRPDLPNAPSLQLAAFAHQKKRQPERVKHADPEQPQLPLVFTGAAGKRHYNPDRVSLRAVG